MKRILALVLSLVLVFALVGCNSAPAASPTPDSTPAATPEPTATPEPAPTPEPTPEPVELIVFAAASMTETITEIVELYKEVAPHVTVIPTFDSSGTLKTQIEEGADVDVFISAAQKQMNALDSSKDGEANPDGLDFVLQGTRINLLENKVALVVPEGNPKDIQSFEDLLSDKLELLVIGNSDVPVGQYTLEILEYLGTGAEALETAGKITYGSNVKEVTTQVSEATADAGVVYATDAFSAGLEVIETATSDMCKQVIYPAAVMNVTRNEVEAKAFLEYLRSAEAMAVFESVGFAPAA